MKAPSRYALALFGSVAFSFAMRLVNLAATVVIVRVCVSFLGLDGYGVLSSLVAFATFFAFGDLGLGLTLMNRVSFAIAREDAAAARAAVTNIAAAVAAVALAILLVLGPVVVLGRERIFGEGASAFGAGLVLALVVLAVANIPLSLAVRVLFGLQRSVAAQAWLTAGRVLTILAVVLAGYAGHGPAGFAVAMLVAPLAASLLSTIWLLGVVRPDLAPASRDLDGATARRELRAGLGMAFIQVTPFIEIGIDSLVAISFFGATEAASIDIVSKLFLYVPALVSVALVPIWPALSAAHAAGNAARFAAVARTCYAVALAATVVGAAVFAFGFEPIAAAWIGAPVPADPILVASFAATAVFMSIGSVQSTILNSRDVVAAQIPIAAAFAALVLAGKLAAGAAGYLPGISLAVSLLYPLRLVVMHLLVTRRHL